MDARSDGLEGKVHSVNGSAIRRDTGRAPSERPSETPVDWSLSLPTVRGLPRTTSSYRDDVRETLAGYEEESLGKLSSAARAVVNLPEFQRQREVYNSAMVYTHLFSNLLVSRFLHQIHAAAQVHDLRTRRDLSSGPLGISDYECRVLEGALLLHDFGHVVGSHATDRVFAGIRSAPDLKKLGFHALDFHELHGAQELGRGGVSPRVRQILGSPLFDDVLAVLTCGDKRPLAEKEKTYGSFKPSLPQDRIEVIHKLEDLLDRSSFVYLDYASAGYRPELVKDAHGIVRRFLDSLHVTESGVSNLAMPLSGADSSVVDDPHEALILARKGLFDNIPMHPLNGLVGAVLERAAWRQFDALYPPEQPPARTTPLYEWARRALFDGRNRDVFGDAWQVLSDESRCVSDSIAPVVTLDKRHLSREGLDAIRSIRTGGPTDRYPEGMVRSVCGAPLAEVSIFELRIRHALKHYGIETPVYVLIAPVLDKNFEYQITTSEACERRSFIADLAGYSGYVVVAAEAIDERGRAVDLSAVQRIVELTISHNSWLKSGIDMRDEFNPHLFVQPLDDRVFDDQFQAHQRSLRPEWLKRGGAGLYRRRAEKGRSE